MPQRETFSYFHSWLRRGARWSGRCFLCSSLWFSICSFGSEPTDNAAVDWKFEATNHLGQWIWETNTFDRQTVRFWKTFEVPLKAQVIRATLRITVDNGYTLFLDGEEIGWFAPEELAGLAMPPLDYPLARGLLRMNMQG